MIDGGDLALLLAAAGGAGALTWSEAAALRNLPRRQGRSVWLRRWPLRTVVGTLLLVALRRVCESLAEIVWSDFDVFLLRRGAVEPATAWLGPLLLALAALLFLRWVVAPPVSGSLAMLLGLAPPMTWWATVRILPLQRHRALELLLPTLLIAIPALLLAAGSWRQSLAELDPARRETLRRLGRIARRAGLLLALLSVWLLSPLHRSALVPGLLTSLATALALVACWRTVRAATPAVALAADWLRQRPLPWLLAGLFACLLHWTLLCVSLPWRLSEERRVLARVAEWPQLLTGQATPEPDDWTLAAARLQALAREYPDHPWTGQWLVMEAWIESTRLHHFYTATLKLREARHEYRRTPVYSPPGWPAGRTIGEVADQVLEDWGRLIEPGAQPS